MSTIGAVNQDHPFGVVPLATIVCPKCAQGEMVYGTLVHPCPEEILGQRSWCSQAFCNKCRYKWYVCRDCPNVQQILDTRQKLSAHTYKFHRATHPLSRNYKARVLVVANGKRKKDGNKDVVSNLPPQDYNSTLVLVKNATGNLPSTPDSSQNIVQQQNETRSRCLGGFPTAVSNCNFVCKESTEYYANNYHRQQGLAYLVLEAFYSGNKAAEDITR
jgi:hypothetical protein